MMMGMMMMMISLINRNNIVRKQLFARRKCFYVGLLLVYVCA